MKRFSASDNARRFLPLAVGVAVVVYLAVNAVHSGKGYFAIGELTGERTAQEKVLADLVEQREVLDRRVKLLGGGKNPLDRDILEEEARRVLGWSRADEVIVLRND